MSYLSESLKKFNKLPEDFKNKIGSIDVVKKLSIAEQHFNIDLKFLVVLVSIGEISLDEVPLYLEKKFNLDKEEGVHLKGFLVDDIFSVVLAEEKESVKNEYDINKAFERDVVKLLNEGNEEKEAFNKDLVVHLLSVENSQKDLLKILYDNKEKVTHKKFTLNNKPHSPSIGNWIKDFIKKHGTKIFDNLVLTKYVTGSENVKKLNDNEKKKVGSILEIYRNLKFFPESMNDASPEEWEIIPVDREIEEGVTKARTVTGPPEQKVEDELVELKRMAEQYPENSLERKAIEEEVEEIEGGEQATASDNSELMKLKRMAEQYPHGSLERKVIEEEMRKLTNK